MPRTSLRTAFPFLVAGLATLAGVLPAEEASALSPYLVVPAPSVAEASSAYKYANMTAAEALAELDKRKVPYKKADPIDGVVAPVRLTGKLHGVHIRSSIPESQRATSVYEVLDARLALALDDFATILSRHDIEEVVHYSLYRPNVPREDHDLKEDKAAAARSAVAAASTTSAPHKAGAAVGKSRGAPASASGSVAKPGVSGAKPPSALPALPAGKPFRALPSKGEPGAGHGAKQKTPIGTEKAPAAAHGTAPAAATKGAPSTKVAPAGAAVQATGKAGRTIGLRAAISPKSSGATPIRARSGAVTKADPKATVTTAAAGGHAHSHAAPATRQTWAAPGTRHPAGLAIDVALLKKRDGQWISVATHFRGRIGDKTCGDGVRTADTPEARELRSIVCEANDLGVFTYVLTPNYNAAHADHFHMEIRPTVKWFLYQ